MREGAGVLREKFEGGMPERVKMKCGGGVAGKFFFLGGGG